MKRRTLLQSLALFLTTGLSRAGAAGFSQGTRLPDLSTFGLEGALPALKGKVVYLDFWASWCAPCKASFPVLNGWQKEFAGKNFTVLAVSVDEKAEDMAKFLKKNAVDFPLVRDATQKLVAAANASTMPTSFLIDRKGVVRLVHSGFRAGDADALHRTITQLVNEA
ncbi:MAG: peroxiredoxin [Verrucomicrobiales bacterium]|nr:peroxiredoxin [Verrucomicrobiales bacterium]